MVTTIDNQGEWKTVTRSDKKRVIRKRSTGKGHTTTLETNRGFIEDNEALYQCLQKCIEFLTETDVYRNFITLWDDLVIGTDRGNVREIVCYGIGNFSNTSAEHFSASLWQLAFAICLRNTFETRTNEEHTTPFVNNRVTLVFYDPCSTLFEITFLKEKISNCLVLDSNDRGNRAAVVNLSDWQNEQPRWTSLYYMPHCPATLYENVVWANWNHIVQSNFPNAIQPTEYESTTSPYISAFVVIVGNSLRNLATRIISKDRDSDDSSLHCNCLQALLPWLHENQFQVTKHDLVINPGNIDGAFNDTFICYWDDVTKSAASNEIPKRPYESIDQNSGDVELL
jgi:SRR1